MLLLTTLHAEQDHSGSIPKILELYPDAKVVTNPKCKDFLKDLLLIPEDKFITINDRETISLGNKTLEFILAPWVHWPETMFTFLKEDKILFTCDFLGSHLAASELFVSDEAKVYESAKRYYAEIIATPTILVGPHPSVVYATYLVNALRPKLKFASVIGSYGWGGRMLEQIKGMLTNLKIDVIEPVIIKGFPREEALKALDVLADNILKKHKEHNIV